MTLFILDPNLERETGHHIEWDLSIARAARARGEATVIYAHRDFPAGMREAAEVVPWFAHTTYERRSEDPVAGRFDDFTYFNETLAGELGRLPRDLFAPGDAVLVPTLTENHLLGYVSWMKSFPATQAPLFVVHLMFPTGLRFDDGFDAMAVGDPLQALFYRLAFRRAREAGAEIHFFGGGRQLAREFSCLVEAPVDPHPVPICPIRQTPKPQGPLRRCLLFAGDAKADKGFTLVPGLADRLTRDFPDWQFVIHANAAAAWGEALAAHEAVAAFAPSRPNLQLLSGRLSNGDYQTLMESCDAMVFTYDPVVYAQKSSGVLWESVSLEIPVLVPQRTWLEREAREWGAGYMTYGAHDVDAICARFADFARGLDALASLSAAAAPRYHAFNGSAAVLDQIGRLWAPRLAAASLVGQPKELTLPLEAQPDEGWYYLEKAEGRPIRWSARVFEVAFDWPFLAGWQLEIKVRNFIGAEQMTQARATAGDAPLSCASTLLEGGGGILTIAGDGPGRDNATVRVTVQLPWTYRPEGEERDLGVLVSGLLVRPAAMAADARREILATSPLEPNEAGDGFVLKGALSGQVLLDPRQDAPVSFQLRTAEGPAVARALRFYLNGTEVALGGTQAGDGLWQMAGRCDARLIAARGLVSEWDLWLPASRGKAGHAEVVGLTIGGNRLGAPTPPPAVPEPAPVSPAPVPRYEDANQPPARSGRQAVLVGQGGSVARVETLHLDQFDGEPGAGYVDLSLFNVHLDGERWEHLKFKLCRSGETPWLEFREMPDWPVVFARWPGVEEDRFGRVFWLGSRMPGAPELLSTARDAVLVRALSLILPEAVAAALHKGGQAARVADWRPSAEAMADHLASLLATAARPDLEPAV